jgi:hypothetical protein
MAQPVAMNCYCRNGGGWRPTRCSVLAKRSIAFIEQKRLTGDYA